MKLPPDHVATTVEVPRKGLRTAMMLVAALVGVPCVAYQERAVCVMSCGWKEPPLIPQSVRGLFALETSASTGWAAPCSLMTASWGAGWAAHVARIAAQAGTAMGVASELGDGLGLGLATGLGLGEGLGVGDPALGVRLAAGASGPFGVQPAAATRHRRRATPILTGDCNGEGDGWVTRAPRFRKWPRIPRGSAVGYEGALRSK